MKYFLTKFKGALISALVFVVLLGFIYFRDSDNKKVVNADGSYDFTIDGEVLALEIYYPKSWVLLENEDGNWVLIKDEESFSPDVKLIHNLIEDIKNTNIAGTLPVDEVDLDQFGIESAKAEIVVSTADADHRFIIGDKIPVGSGTYVYIPDENLVLVAEKDYLNNYLNLSPEDFRDRDLFDFDSEAVNRISIRSASFNVDMFKEDGEWYLEEDDQLFVDENKIDEILWIFAKAKVLNFEDENPDSLTKYGLDEPLAEIRFYQDDRIQGVFFGKRKDKDSYYIKSDSDGAVYSIHKSLFKRIPKNIDQISSN
jgi:hypothetical protein